MHEARIEHGFDDHDDAGFLAFHFVHCFDIAVQHHWFDEQHRHDPGHVVQRHELHGRDRHRQHVERHGHERQRHEQLDGIAVHGRRVQLDRHIGLELDDALMGLRHFALALAMLASLGLGACHRGSTANEHATQGEPTAKGTTGTGNVGTSAMGGPGSGLNGGLAPRGSASASTGVAEGSTNRTSRAAVGNR